MKIAILGPSPIPYTRGGVETLLARLHDTINRQTPHAAELIKIPVREDGFLRTLRAYRRFHRLDLTHFDLVITTKYPAWMIRHPNHLVYLQHRLRGVYDTYPGRTGFWAYLTEPPWRMAGVWMRKIVRLLDGRALRYGRVDHFFCISHTVRSRREYFPTGAHPVVVYHPPALDRYECSTGRHLLAVSRLDAPKRIDLAIHAMSHVRGDVELLIVGDGPQRPHLKVLAARDPRIRLLGMVSDDRLRKLYAEAIGVIYTPYAEDYGLITIEAFKSGKPVVTCADSGGPLEFVRDAETGYVTDPEPEAVAHAVQRLLDDPSEAAALGRRGRRTVEGIEWLPTVQPFLDCYRWLEARPSEPTEKRRLLLLSTFPLTPVRHGGQARLFHLYRELSRYWRVTALCMGYPGEPYRHVTHSDDFEEIVVEPTPEHARRQALAERATGGQPVFDVTLPELVHRTPLFGKILRHALRLADLVVCAHPYLWAELDAPSRARLKIYEAVDCEVTQKQEYLGRTRRGRRLLEVVRRLEARACREADLTLTVSEPVAQELRELHGLDPVRTVATPNGAPVTEIEPPDPAERSRARERLDLGQGPVAVFLGGWHPPNLEALRILLQQLAPAMPDLTFLVVGAVKDEYEKEVGSLEPPHNVRVLGYVDEETKRAALAAADLALNPVRSGSGTNLKLLDYLAHGLPTVTTPTGCRGIPARAGQHLVLAEIPGFPTAIRQLLQECWGAQDMGRQGRDLVLQRFSWRGIARDVFQAVESRLISPLPSRLELPDSPWLRSGFHGPEQWTDPATGKVFPARWTGPRAVLHVPSRAGRNRLELQLMAPAGGAPVRLLHDGQLLLDRSLEEGWHRVEVELEGRPGRDALEMVLETEGWSPREKLGVPDPRCLGLGIRGGSIEPEEP